MQLLIEAFNPASVAGLMCRNTLSINWRGEVYDCDFNQQLGLHAGQHHPLFLWRSSCATGKHAYRRRQPLLRLHRWFWFLVWRRPDVINEVAALLSFNIRSARKRFPRARRIWFIVAAQTRPWGHGRDSLPRFKVSRTSRLQQCKRCA